MGEIDLDHSDFTWSHQDEDAHKTKVFVFLSRLHFYIISLSAPCQVAFEARENLYDNCLQKAQGRKSCSFLLQNCSSNKLNL